MSVHVCGSLNPEFYEMFHPAKHTFVYHAVSVQYNREVGDALLLRPCYIRAYNTKSNQPCNISYYGNMIQKNYCNK